MSLPPASTKLEIHRAACRLFRQRGFHAAGVREIAESVGLQGGSLYAHMQKKDDLLWEIVNEAGDRFFAALDRVLAAPLPAIDKLRRAIIDHVEVITGDIDAATVFTVEWRHLSPERREQVTRRRDDYERRFRSLIEQALHEGGLAVTDAATAARFVLSALNAVVFWYKPDGRLSPGQIGEMLADHLFHGLCQARPPRSVHATRVRLADHAVARSKKKAKP